MLTDANSIPDFFFFFMLGEKLSSNFIPIAVANAKHGSDIAGSIAT